MRRVVAVTTVVVTSAAETHALGRRLGAAARSGQIIALRGGLGAGKTTLTQGIAAGLGITARVTSPTFTLVNEYAPGSQGLALIHIDIYRLGDAPDAVQREVETFGLEEILSTAGQPEVVAGAGSKGSVVVIEWAEKVASLLPADHLDIQLAAVSGAPESRSITLASGGSRSAALLEAVMG